MLHLNQAECLAQIKVLKPGAEISIYGDSFILIGKHTDNSIGLDNNRSDNLLFYLYWIPNSNKADSSLKNRAEYVALYKRNSSLTDYNVLLELRSAQKNSSDSASSTTFQLKITDGDLKQLCKELSSIFLPRNFRNRDYSLSIELDNMVNIVARRAVIYDRKYIIVKVSQKRKEGVFLLTEKGLENLFEGVK